MDMLKRAFGIAGHNTQRARIITRAADDLTRESRALNEHLSRYTGADDPFTALVQDMVNQRALRGHERFPT